MSENSVVCAAILLTHFLIIKYQGEGAVKRCEGQVFFSLISFPYHTLVCSLLCMLDYLQLLLA